MCPEAVHLGVCTWQPQHYAPAFVRGSRHHNSAQRAPAPVFRNPVAAYMKILQTKYARRLTLGPVRG